MIINFRVKNYLSFSQGVEFTALATPERQHRERVFHNKKAGLSILPVAAFYGGNGAGKSNLYHALKFARSLVLKAGTKPEDTIERDPFLLDPACVSSPSVFGFDLLIADESLRYEFAVTADCVVSESLGFLKSDKVKYIFHRDRKEGKDFWTPESFQELKLKKDDDDFLRFKIRDTLPNELFLAVLRGRKIPVLEDVGNWFKNNLVLLDPHCDFRPVELGLMHAEDFKSYCTESLVKSGTGIDQIKTEPALLESIPIPAKIRDDMVKHLQAGDKDGMLMLRGHDRTRFMLRRRKGEEVEAFKLTTFHKSTDGKQIGFEISDESEGTERLIDLLPAFFELSSPDTDKVFFIDELDRSLHTHLTRRLVESFLETRTSASRAQLLFTTHDPLLIDQELFRRDELWFLDKMTGGHSKLSSLSDFKGVRYDKDIRKNYLLGRFAGVPETEPLPRRSHEAVSAT